jgi:hypothetical protein
VFELVYSQLPEKPDKDTVLLDSLVRVWKRERISEV